VDAIRSGDGDRIDAVMDEHLAELERAYERDADDAPSATPPTVVAVAAPAVAPL